MTLGGFGAAAGVFALFFFGEVPKVRNDILQHVPFIGDRFRREIPASDNVRFHNPSRYRQRESEMHMWKGDESLGATTWVQSRVLGESRRNGSRENTPTRLPNLASCSICTLRCLFHAGPRHTSRPALTHTTAFLNQHNTKNERSRRHVEVLEFGLYIKRSANRKKALLFMLHASGSSPSRVPCAH